MQQGRTRSMLQSGQSKVLLLLANLLLGRQDVSSSLLPPPGKVWSANGRASSTICRLQSLYGVDVAGEPASFPSPAVPASQSSVSGQPSQPYGLQCLGCSSWRRLIGVLERQSPWHTREPSFFFFFSSERDMARAALSSSARAVLNTIFNGLVKASLEQFSAPHV